MASLQCSSTPAPLQCSSSLGRGITDPRLTSPVPSSVGNELIDPRLSAHVQSVGKELNAVLARFHAVARHAPSAVATDGVVQSVPRSIIDSWEAKAMQMQRRLDASEHEKAAVVQRSLSQLRPAASHFSVLELDPQCSASACALQTDGGGASAATMMDVAKAPTAESRLSRLRAVAGGALEASLASCDEFCDGFALEALHRPLLEEVYRAAVGEMRGHVLSECDLIFREAGVAESLNRLDREEARQPAQAGSRCPQLAAMLSRSMLPVKQKHVLVLQQALQKVQQENAALKQQWLASHAHLSTGSEQIDSCMTNLEQSAMQCEP